MLCIVFIVEIKTREKTECCKGISFFAELGDIIVHGLAHMFDLFLLIGHNWI